MTEQLPDRFEILLKHIQFPMTPTTEKAFEQAQIKAINVYPERRLWTFHIEVTDILPYPIFKEFYQRLIATFDNIANVKLVMHTREPRINQQKVLEYWRYVCHVSQIDSPLCNKSFQEDVPFVEDGRVFFKIEHEVMQEKYAQQFLPMLAKEYIKVGFPNHFSIQPTLDRQAETEKINHFAKQTAQENYEVARELSEKHEKIQQRQKPKSKKTSVQTEVQLGRSINANQPIWQMKEITEEERNVVIQGYVFEVETRDLRSGRQILTFKMTDYTSSFACKRFSNSEEDEEIFAQIKEGMWLKVQGNVQEDRYLNDLVLLAQNIQEVHVEEKMDGAPADEKRVELHAHTQMSQMDATNSATDLINRAVKWGHKAVAITDHGAVYAFPEAHTAAKGKDIQVIYGMEAYIVDDGELVAYHPQDEDLSEATYVVFDVETTGLSAIYDSIIELAGVKMYKGNVIDSFQEFIDPGHPLSDTTTNLTGITTEMVRAAEKSEEQVLKEFKVFTEGTIIVAHNASFDIGFLNAGYEKYQMSEVSEPVIDTLALSRMLHPHIKSHRLNTLAKRYDVYLEQHHRAIYDAETTGRLLDIFLKEAQEDFGMSNLNQLNDHVGEGDSYKRSRPFHATLLVQTQKGLKNLFKLVSASYVKYFYRLPRIPRSVFEKYREGILLGSACAEGEVFEAMMQKGYDQAKKIAKNYDYLEVMPKSSYKDLLAKELIRNEKDLEDILKNIAKLGEELDIPVVATGNVHYLDEKDKIYREIILTTLHQTGDAEIVYPDLDFKTTGEMLAAFSFLGEEKAYELVVTNSQKIAAMIDDDITPVKSKLYTPKMPNAEEEITEKTYEEAKRRYGDPLPEVIEKRIDKELTSIIGNGFAVIYLISKKLVDESMENGYLVGSRGSVGSSFVAHMTGITEVNPLPPHYHCKSCHYSEFFDDGSIGSGFDLEPKKCPNCGADLDMDGQDIPFETFLGFNGEKVPDIDLNFSGEYQASAHEYTKVLFGEDHVYKAGTISTIADKTAFGYVKGYERDLHKMYNKAEIDRLTKGVSGARRTTGQHPGGIIVIPDDMEVYDFTPVQYPANDQTADWRTTHFDFHSIDDNVLKLDILGHDDPTMIRMLQDLSGINPQAIPLNDPGVMQLFQGTEVLGVTPEQIFSKTGTLGIPEFGTGFVRSMLEKTRPTTFAELVQISGLSHGTDVWLGNAEELIDHHGIPLSEVIGCRDDIMVYLSHAGLEEVVAFRIMESVRKGRGLSDEWISTMKEHQVPQWYIESCLKIKYMFPKAHATAYIIMALRVAYFKVHYPLYYYAAYFSIRANDFELEAMCKGKEAVKNILKEIYSKGNDATAKEKNLAVVLELANEMLERGFQFEMVELKESDAKNFTIKDEKTLLAPFRAVPSFGTSAADSVVEARKDGEFLSKEDLLKRTRVNSSVLEYLDRNHVTSHLPDENQLSLF